MKRGYLGFLLIFNLVIGLFLGAQAMSFISTTDAPSVVPLTFRDAPSVTLSSPSNHIAESNIKVYEDRVTIYLDGFQTGWARFAPTNSMSPVLRDGHNSIEITPQNEHNIHVGDIISFHYPSRDALRSELVVHRVVDIGNDGQWFARTKGDNNNDIDPGKRRFQDIEGIIVVLVY